MLDVLIHQTLSVSSFRYVGRILPHYHCESVRAASVRDAMNVCI